MTAKQPQIEALYEIALAIRQHERPAETARHALAAYVDQLGCSLGVVLERTEGSFSYDPVGAVPTSPEGTELYDAVQTRLSDRADRPETQRESFPISGRSEAGAYWLFDLPDFGVLLLDGDIDQSTAQALGSVNDTLAAACCHGREAAHFRAERNRFEWLYNESRRILSSEDTEAICEHALAASQELVDFSRAAVYRYDRQSEALTPVVTAEPGREGETDWEPYTEDASVAWEVYGSGPRWFEDLSNCELTVPCGEKHGSAMFLPLGDHGVLMLATETPGVFEEIDFQVAKLLSVVTEVALDRALREEGLSEAQEITRRILDANDHEEAARGVLEQLPQALDMPLSAIWRYDAGTDRLEPVAATDRALTLIEEIPIFSNADSIAWQAFTQGETKLVADVPDHEDVYNENTAFNSEIIMPLGDFGVLSTASTRRGSFTEADRRLLEMLAGNVETAMRLVSRRHERDLLDQVIARVLRHNLRNDLNVIQGHAMALADHPEVSDHAQAIIDHCKGLQKTAQNARKMREIVNSSGEITSVAIPEVVDHALRRITDSFPNTEITVEFESTPQVLAHPALPIAIEQLLENSIEHANRPDEEIAVGITIAENDGQVIIEIADNGPGIPREELDILDQHGESALEHGSGAGLWMVDRVVEYSNATINFNTDDGTTVRLSFDPA